jgi:hypothetical protein
VIDMTATTLPVDRRLVDYLLGEFAALGPKGEGLAAYARFTRQLGHRKGALGVDVHADGSVVLTHLGSRYWQVRFESTGRTVRLAPVPAPVIIAAIVAAIEEG